jgi:hypothetical protein
MAITLAATWYPRGELPRFKRFLPLLQEHYVQLVICCIPSDDPTFQAELTSGAFSADPKVIFSVNDVCSNGRYLAIKKALEISSDFIHYADLDRLLHWVETRPDEWKAALAVMDQHDCIIFGRTEVAMCTHPRALVNTEIASNRVVSHFLGREMDVSAGSKSFCRRAAQFLVEHSRSDNSIATDAEWPILLERAGFGLHYYLVDGLDWESADQYQPRAATAQEQQEAASRYDADPAHWAARVDIANQIISAAVVLSHSQSSHER